MLYRDTTTGLLRTESELVDLLCTVGSREDGELLLRNVELRSNEGLREHLERAGFAGAYSGVDGYEVLFRRCTDGELFYANQLEVYFHVEVRKLDEPTRRRTTFAGWLGTKIPHGVFTVVDAVEEIA